MAFPGSKEPNTALGRHRVLSPTCGLRVSPLALGAMSIGDAWKEFMGSMDKKASFELLDAFYEAGGNFIGESSPLGRISCCLTNEFLFLRQIRQTTTK